MTKKPRILHLIDVGDTGGAETVFVQLVRHFEQESQNAMVVLPSHGWIAQQLLDISTPQTFVRSKGAFNVSLLTAIWNHARTSQANVLLAHLLGSSVYGAIVGLVLRIPVIAIFHGKIDFEEPGRFQNVKRRLLSCPHVRIVAVSEGIRDALIDWGIPPRQVSVIQNGIDTGAFRPTDSEQLRRELRIEPGTRIIGAVGNLHKVKRYEHMLLVAHHLKQYLRKFVFVVAGDGPPDYRSRLCELRSEMALDDNFEFLGFRQATSDLYSGMDVFVSTASSEGLPLSFLEAMSCEVPIVATANEGSTPLLSTCKCGRLVSEADPALFADTIHATLEDPELGRQYGRNGRRAATTFFSVEATLRRYEELISETLVQRRGS